MSCNFNCHGLKLTPSIEHSINTSKTSVRCNHRIETRVTHLRALSYDNSEQLLLVTAGLQQKHVDIPFERRL